MINRRKGFLLSLLLLVSIPVGLFSVTSPDAFLGHRVGQDRKLVDYNQIRAYFARLDQESDKLKLLTIGQSTLGKPMIMAVISSKVNLDKLDEYRGLVRQLRDARGLSAEAAKTLAKQGKVLLLITCSLHATEIAASQMSLEFAYNLVTGNTPFAADKILDDVIVLLIPTINPDGNQMVCDYYRKYVGTQYEGGPMPWLYHHYAGHDNNRDWFMFNLSETRAVTQVLYHDWIPQIHIDEHQMGSTGARLFLPPFMDPPVPNVHPLVWRGVGLCGVGMAYDLQKEGYKGVVYDRDFTGWWIGACDDTSWLHNGIGLLSEMASAKVASPVYIDPTELQANYVEKRVNFPDPWPGGWWRLRDLVDYESVLSMSLVKTAALHKEDFLYNFYQMCRESIDERAKGQPFAFVIPQEQRDYPTTLKMLEILKMGGVEIHQAKKDFIADGRIYPAGAFVVLLSQPYRPYAQALLEKQHYPDMREFPGGPPIPPYDNAAWTLPLQMGVACDPVNRPFETELVKLNTVPWPEIKPISATAPYIRLDARANAAYAVVFALLKTGAEVSRITASPKAGESHGCPGTFLVKNTPAVQKVLPGLLGKWHINAQEMESIEGITRIPVKNPRIGLYQSFRGNMDEGWTRYLFDDMGIAYTSVRPKDFKVKKGAKLDLRKNFDVLVFADENPDIIKTGKPPMDGRGFGRIAIDMPPEYEGGIEKEGVEALKEFVGQGGILVALNEASQLVLKEFNPPVRDALDKVDENKFFCPTSILRARIDTASPLGYGMPEEAAVMFADSLAFNSRIPGGDWDRNVVASYPEKDILLSGWLLGEEMITRKAALIDLRFKKGHILLFGFRCQHRAQSHGTYKLLLNGLLYPRE